MFTLHETITKLDLWGMRIQRYGSLQWAIFFRDNPSNYRLVDELGEVPEVSTDMKRERDGNEQGDMSW